MLGLSFVKTAEEERLQYAPGINHGTRISHKAVGAVGWQRAKHLR